MPWASRSEIRIPSPDASSAVPWVAGRPGSSVWKLSPGVCSSSVGSLKRTMMTWKSDRMTATASSEVVKLAHTAHCR